METDRSHAQRGARILDASLVLARAKAGVGLFSDALKEAQRALDLAPRSVKAHRCHAECLRGLYRFREAAASYERAIQLAHHGNDTSSPPPGGAETEASQADVEQLEAELRGVLEEERATAEELRLASLPVYDSPLCLGASGQLWKEVD